MGSSCPSVAGPWGRASEGSKLSEGDLVTADHPPGDPDRKTFLATLDALTEGVAFLDQRGTLVHENGRLAGLRSTDPGAVDARLRSFVERMRRRVASLDLAGAPVVEKLAAEELPLDAVDCLLEGSYVGFDLLGVGPLLMVTVSCAGRRALDEEELRAAYGLTPGEIRVAKLLAEGRPNAEIASCLSISGATSRHHTARVLRKLGARSRAEAAALLLGARRSEVGAGDRGRGER